MSWIKDVEDCINDLGKEKFSLDDIYAYEKTLQEKHPQNKHVKDKIRQQLQFLRDKNRIEFLEPGIYRVR